MIESQKLKLENNHFHFLLLGELNKNSDHEKARFYLQKAYSLAKTQMEKQGIQEKIDSLAVSANPAHDDAINPRNYRD